MSLAYTSTQVVPEETMRVAKAALGEGNLAMQLRDKLWCVYDDQDFADLYPDRGQPGLCAWRLALVTILQFAEGLSDRQAAEAVRDRVSWKYALGLELTDDGFDASVLSEFRGRLLAEEAEYRLLNQLLRLLEAHHLLKAGGRMRTDSTHILAAVRTLNRLTCVGETLRHALNEIAQVAPRWLQSQVTGDWYERYGRRFEDYRLPKTEKERWALAATIGQDGLRLLNALETVQAPPIVQDLAAVTTLRQVWQQHYLTDGTGQVQWCAAADLPANATLIVSPYDIEARHSTKRQTDWTGYKVHVTETCDEQGPHLITHVETTPATTSDEQMIGPIHAALAHRGLLPREHLVDAGYVDSARLVDSQREYGISLLGPTPADTSWQARAGQGFDIAHFVVDWQAKTVTCPAGHTTSNWQTPHLHHGVPEIHVDFDLATCRACPCRPQCSHSKSAGRSITLRPEAQFIALQAARQRQTTADFKQQYAARSGIEGTLSQGIRLTDLRQTRYLGLAKTRLQHILIAVALNLIRVIAWLADLPLAQTRLSPFAALASLNNGAP